MRSHVYTSSNLNPNIRLTFCDGDCISLLFHTSPFPKGEWPSRFSRESHFLGYPDGGEIKGIAEIKESGKIKEGQWREIAGFSVPRHALAVMSREIEPRFLAHPFAPAVVSRQGFGTFGANRMHDFISTSRNDVACTSRPGVFTGRLFRKEKKKETRKPPPSSARAHAHSLAEIKLLNSTCTDAKSAGTSCPLNPGILL